MSEMAEAIRQLIQEKGYTEYSVRQIIERALKAAYKKTYGTDENAIVKFEDDMSDVSIYSRKVVVEQVTNPVREIELAEALKYSSELEEGDEIDILEEPNTFDRSAVSTGKQAVHQGLNESLKTSLTNEYKDKIGEMIVGTIQREKNGNIYVDLGNTGKLEGFLPLKYQSKLEYYEKNDRIKALIVDIKPTSSGIQLILSRSDPKLVSIILEKEVPEIADHTVEIQKIVRDAGYRTKIAVSASREEIDPVGACVGPKGLRIQNVIKELLNEKIDILKWDSDPVVFIKNALSPAQVERVIITDAEKRQALAIVEESQFSLAIGRQGQNVRLANKLCDWNIDVKTVEQASELDLSSFTTVQNAQNLFTDEEVYEDEGNLISEIPYEDKEVIAILQENGINTIQDFIDSYNNNSINIDSLSQEVLDEINNVINENYEIVDEDELSEQENEEEYVDENTTEEDADDVVYECSECGERLTRDMTQCPNCGILLDFGEGEE